MNDSMDKPADNTPHDILPPEQDKPMALPPPVPVKQPGFFKRLFMTRKKRQAVAIQNGYLEMVDLIRAIRDHLDRQEVVQTSLLSMLEKVPGTVEKQHEVLNMFQRQLENNIENDKRLTDSMSNLNTTLSSIDQNQKSSAHTITDMIHRSRESEQLLREVMRRSERRMTALLILFVIVIIGAAVYFNRSNRPAKLIQAVPVAAVESADEQPTEPEKAKPEEKAAVAKPEKKDKAEKPAVAPVKEKKAEDKKVGAQKDKAEPAKVEKEKVAADKPAVKVEEKPAVKAEEKPAVKAEEKPTAKLEKKMVNPRRKIDAFQDVQKGKDKAADEEEVKKAKEVPAAAVAPAAGKVEKQDKKAVEKEKAKAADEKAAVKKDEGKDKPKAKDKEKAKAAKDKPAADKKQDEQPKAEVVEAVVVVEVPADVPPPSLDLTEQAIGQIKPDENPAPISKP